MPTNPNIILSVLVISHNQRELLKRCMQSVLTQRIRVPWEIILSDDRSTDGTYELSAQYALQYPATTQQDDGCYQPHIVAVRCNSNECDPITRSERCGWNKLTAWKHAHGKYMVNIDADDYLKSYDIYQLQIEALESHPECYLCHQGVWVLNEGEPTDKGHEMLRHPLIKEGSILKTNQTCMMGLRDLNQSYMMRRHEGDDMEQLYGKLYDDTVITYHHMQFGPTICIGRADYVWVQYPSSISHSLNKMDEIVSYGLLPVHHAVLIPSLAGMFLSCERMEILHALKALRDMDLSEMSDEERLYLSQFSGFVYDLIAGRKKGLLANLHLRWCIFLCLLIGKYHLSSKRILRLWATSLLNPRIVRSFYVQS